jgi:signal transduction histidine kinase/phage shock protein PspC (stress-responsive transcriptional regulator)
LRSTDRVVSGAAAGWAQRWRVEPTVVRAAVTLLTFVAGLGAVAYLAMVVLSDPASAQREPPARRTIDGRRSWSIAFGTAAILVLARWVGVWPGDAIMVPASAVALGVAVVWSERLHHDTSTIPPIARRITRLVAGVALLVAGLASLASQTGGIGAVGASASAIAVVVGGLAVFGAPAVGRLLHELDEERSMRIREDELARVSAHLHDSVLQSLVLIQRSDDPRRMANLARRQERELRSWLYGDAPIGEPTTLHTAIEALTAEIENDHDTRIEAVIVGDQPLDDEARTLVAAMREAIVNAVQHAGVDRVDVFVEADDAELTGFVRDTGAGFDTAAIRSGRRGISDSIVGRVERAGGTATIASQTGVGTEVELRIPRKR